MNALESVLRVASHDLADLQLRWALVGGLAVSARTEPRFTRDVDLVIAVSGDREAEQAIHSLQQRGYQVQALVEQEAAGRLATARRRVAQPVDLDAARQVVTLIQARDFQRDRDLPGDLERLIAHGP